MSTSGLLRVSFGHYNGDYGTVELWFRVSSDLAYALIMPTDENTHANSWVLYKVVGSEKTLVREV